MTRQYNYSFAHKAKIASRRAVKDKEKDCRIKQKVSVYEQNADGNDADEHEANDDHHNSTIIDFLLSNAYFIFIYSSTFSNTS